MQPLLASHLQKAVENVNCEEQRLLQQVEAHVHLDQPIDENAAHATRDLVTAQEPTGARNRVGDYYSYIGILCYNATRREYSLIMDGEFLLQFAHVVVDAGHVFAAQLRVVAVLTVDVGHVCRENRLGNRDLQR